MMFDRADGHYDLASAFPEEPAGLRRRRGLLLLSAA